jgi:hypothetical protein
MDSALSVAQKAAERGLPIVAGRSSRAAKRPGKATVIRSSTVRSLEQVAGELHQEHLAAERDVRSAVAHAIRAGNLLLEAKGIVTHGFFGVWLTNNFKGGPRTAQNYMRLARDAATDPANTQRVSHSTVRGALQAIARRKRSTTADMPAARANAKVIDVTPISVTNDDMTPVSDVVAAPDVQLEARAEYIARLSVAMEYIDMAFGAIAPSYRQNFVDDMVDHLRAQAAHA